MQNQIAVFRDKHGVRAMSLSSNSTAAERTEVDNQLVHRVPNLRLLYVTPEQLSANDKLIERLQSLLAVGKLVLMAIDEAHCVLQWGAKPNAEKQNNPRAGASSRAAQAPLTSSALSAATFSAILAQCHARASPLVPRNRSPLLSLAVSQATIFARSILSSETSASGSRRGASSCPSWRAIFAPPRPPRLRVALKLGPGEP